MTDGSNIKNDLIKSITSSSNDVINQSLSKLNLSKDQIVTGFNKELDTSKNTILKTIEESKTKLLNESSAEINKIKSSLLISIP